MATNYVHDGSVVTVVSPSIKGSGGGVLVGNLFGVALTSAASAAAVAIQTQGVFTLPKVTGASTAFAQGANVHYHDAGNNCTVSATANIKIGVAVAAADNNATTVQVRLTGSW